MIERFRTALERLVGEPGRQRYLLAISGGADSSVMAHLFHNAGYDFAIAHCNFHLRGEDSNADMRLVQNLAKTLEVTIFVKEFDTWTLQKDSGLSVEMMARKLRYDWFEEIGGDFDYIVTAHHANDALETTLLNICRGTGLKGLASIPSENGKIIRPMLGFSAKEIRAYASSHHIEYAIDCTNADETIRRNRIRHSVVPQLEEINPNLIHTFTHNREILQRQLAFYQHSIEKIKKQVMTSKDDAFVVDVSILENHPDKDVILYEILNDFGFNSSIVENLGSELQSGRQFFSEKYVLLVNRDKYIIQSKNIDCQDSIMIDSIEVLKKYFRVELVSQSEEIIFPKNSDILFIPEDKLLFPLELRHWREGDSFYPLGAKGRQKLSDFFIDHKVDVFTKQKIWLLCTPKEIVWIVGYRSSESFKIDRKKMKSYYKIIYDGLF